MRGDHLVRSIPRGRSLPLGTRQRLLDDLYRALLRPVDEQPAPEDGDAVLAPAATVGEEVHEATGSRTGGGYPAVFAGTPESRL